MHNIYSYRETEDHIVIKRLSGISLCFCHDLKTTLLKSLCVLVGCTLRLLLWSSNMP